MAHYNNAFGIKLGLINEYINCPHDAPAPCCDGAPSVFACGRDPCFFEMRLDTHAFIFHIGINIACVKGCNCKALCKGFFNIPSIFLSAPAFFGRLIVYNPGVAIIHPSGRDFDRSIINKHMVACEVHADEYGNFFFALCGDCKKHLDGGS